MKRGDPWSEDPFDAVMRTKFWRLSGYLKNRMKDAPMNKDSKYDFLLFGIVNET